MTTPTHQPPLPGFAVPDAQAALDPQLAAYLLSRSQTCSPRTLRLYRCVLTRFDVWRAARPISPLLIESYLRTYAGKADDTRANVYAVLKRACRWLHGRGYLDADPFSGPAPVPPPRRTRVRRATYTEADVRRLLLAAGPSTPGTRKRWADDGPRAREAQQARALILLLIDSALRASEVCSLSCGAVRARDLIVTGKGGHQDRVFLTAATHALLRELAGERPNDAPLFRTWTGGPATPASLRGLVERTAARAGIDVPPRCLHSFRHYAAQGWARSSVPDLVIKRWMRHASLDTTRIYTDGARDDELAALHERVSMVHELMKEA